MGKIVQLVLFVNGTLALATYFGVKFTAKKLKQKSADALHVVFPVSEGFAVLYSRPGGWWLAGEFENEEDANHAARTSLPSGVRWRVVSTNHPDYKDAVAAGRTSIGLEE